MTVGASSHGDLIVTAAGAPRRTFLEMGKFVH